MLTPNTSSELHNAAIGSDFPDSHRPEEGENIYRLVYGPVKNTQAWYATMKKNDESNEMEPRFHPIRFDSANTPEVLKFLAATDKQLAIEDIADEEKRRKFRSGWSGTTRYMYWGFDRANDRKRGKPEIVLIELPYSVVKEAKALQEKRDKKDESILRFGTLPMFDIIVTKTIDKKIKNAQFATSYSVEPDYETVPQYEIPDTAVWNNDFIAEAGLETFYSAEEIEALKQHTANLDELFKPQNAVSVLETLAQYPPVLDYCREENRPVFPGLAKLALPEYQEAYAKLNSGLTEFASDLGVALLEAPDSVGESESGNEEESDVVEDAEVVEESDEVEQSDEVEETPKPVTSTKLKAKVTPGSIEKKKLPAASAPSVASAPSADKPKKKLWSKK